MKRILAFTLGASLIAGQVVAAEEVRARGSRLRVPNAGNTAEQRVATPPRDMRVRVQPSTSQTAIRSEPTRSFVRDNDRSTVRVERRDRDNDRDDGRRDRDYDRGDRDNDRRDWDRGDRNWSDRRYTRVPSTIYRGWDRNRVYSWNNNRWRWYGGTWVIYSPTPTYYSTLPAVGSSVVVEVQQELRREGYYRGAADGVIGPRTRTAIASFQRDNGLAVTGRINNSLLRELDLL
jgi:hypothetical protein